VIIFDMQKTATLVVHNNRALGIPKVSMDEIQLDFIKTI